MEEIMCIVTGRVQMVMFRDFAQRKARSLNIGGSVQNLKDGSVQVIAQGSRKSLETYIHHLQKGSLLSRVDSVIVEWGAAKELFDDFTILY